MMRISVAICTLIALAAPAALAEDDFIPSSALQKVDLIQFWQLQLTLEEDQALQTAYLVDDTLYLGTQDGYLFSVDAYSGAIRWLRQVTGSGYEVRRPCHAGDKTIVVTPIDVQIYQRRSGDPIARRQLRFPAGTGPMSDGNLLFIGGIDHRLYVLDIDTLFVRWRLVVDGPITSTPAQYGDNVVMADDAGSVYACTRADKVRRWRGTTFARVSADLVVNDQGVYVASHDQSLYLMDLTYGRARWRARFSGPLYEAPVVTKEAAYQYCPNDGLVAVETEVVSVENRMRWTLPQGRKALTIHDGHTFVLAGDGSILAVNTATGEVMHTFSAAGLTLPIPAPDAETIYLASADGRLFCAKPRSVTPLSRQDVLKALAGADQPAEDEAGAGEVAPGDGATPAKADDDPLRTKRGGRPVGGKSKVTEEFGKNEKSK